MARKLERVLIIRYPDGRTVEQHFSDALLRMLEKSMDWDGERTQGFSYCERFAADERLGGE
jgi:hypothetical protein